MIKIGIMTFRNEPVISMSESDFSNGVRESLFVGKGLKFIYAFPLKTMDFKELNATGHDCINMCRLR